MIALHYAARHPNEAKAIVLCNPSPGPTRARSWSRVETVVAAGSMTSVSEQATAQAFGVLPHDERYRHYRDEIFGVADPVSFKFAVEGLLDLTAESVLADIRCPVLVIGGGLDLNNPPEILGAQFAAALPNAMLEIVPNASHLGPYQAPAAFAELTAPFLLKNDN